jgi:hypothetical protein
VIGRLAHRRLPPGSARLLAAALVAEVTVGIALRLIPVPLLWRAVRRLRPIARRAASAPEQRVAWAIEAVGRRLPRLSTCLVRALTADLFLTVPGSVTHVRVGVRRSTRGALESHAWFERDGRIVVGGGDARDYVDFVALDTAISERA